MPRYRRRKFNISTKYCRKFCSGGFCEKGPKCAFVHEPSKIAICPLFIYGNCKIPNCQLSHEPIPEKMPDCLFFSMNKCTAKNCLFRHVKVNEKAPLCENFLRGYCLDGFKCKSRHQFECRSFNAKGKCPKGNKCKFAHRYQEKKKIKTNQNQYKKINNINSNNKNATVNVVKQPKTVSETPPKPRRSILNELLAKRLKSVPLKLTTVVNLEQKMDLNSLPEYIELASLDGLLDSSLNNYSKIENEQNIAETVTVSNKSIDFGERIKYFITDPEEKLRESFRNCGNPESTSKFRPKLKIIPDFLTETSID